MALPDNAKQPWPPAAWEDVYAQYALHAAWYGGDPNKLAQAYAATLSRVSAFWSRQVKAERRVTLHVPVAGDISSTSASMLFSEHPRIRIPEAQEEKPDTEARAAQARLEEIIAKAGVFSRLLEAAELCSAFGGVFLKVNWDEQLASYPILSVADADAALPEFRHGILVAVTLWKVLAEEKSGVVWRFVERHEPGAILNGLYSGTADRLGDKQTLEARPETTGLQDVVWTGLDGLAVRYIPNIRPNRRFRALSLGQSDYAGGEGIFEAVDEVWSSLIREIRLGQGRIMAPESFFERDQKGEFRFDVDREAYIALNSPVSATGAKDQITVSQFAIRTDEHLGALRNLLTQAFSNAGYSPQTFGLEIAGRTDSGTALRIRERKSFITTAKKAEYWRPAIEDICEIMLIVDSKHLRSGIRSYRPAVEIQDSVQGNVDEVASSVEMLNRAQATSTRTRVAMLHPEWERAQIEAEVTAIQEESGQAVPDAMQIGVA